MSTKFTIQHLWDDETQSGYHLFTDAMDSFMVDDMVGKEPVYLEPKTAVSWFQKPFALSLSKGERVLEPHPTGERGKSRPCFDRLSTNGFFCIQTAVFRLN